MLSQGKSTNRGLPGIQQPQCTLARSCRTSSARKDIRKTSKVSKTPAIDWPQNPTKCTHNFVDQAKQNCAISHRLKTAAPSLWQSQMRCERLWQPTRHAQSVMVTSLARSRGSRPSKLPRFPQTCLLLNITLSVLTLVLVDMPPLHDDCYHSSSSSPFFFNSSTTAGRIISISSS